MTSGNEQYSPVMNSNHQVTTKKIKITAKQHTFNIKASAIPLILGKFGPKTKIYS